MEKQRISGLYGLALDLDEAVVCFECDWKVCSDVLPYATALDLSLRRLPAAANACVLPSRHPGDSTGIYQFDVVSSHGHPQRLDPRTAREAIQFLTKLLTDLARREATTVTSLKLLVPVTAGYVARNDVFERRLEGCKLSRYAQTFVRPLQYIQPIPDEADFPNLRALLPYVLGGMVLREQHDAAADINIALELANEELTNRLSHTWILPDPLVRKRLVVVCGRGDYANSALIWATAAALGIDLVVLDAADHWLQRPEHVSLREACVPTDITIDAGVVARIVAAIHAYPFSVDGILTFESAYVLVVARAAQALQLPTSDPAAVATSCDKALTRALEPSASESFECSSVPQLQARLDDPDAPPLRFPLIIKPCTGWSSERVTRADDAEALVTAVTNAIGHRAESEFTRAACVVEPYVDGPEFDANFVLLDGRILFADISDDYPSVSDAADASVAGNFLETQIVLPSRLPESEQTLIREAMLASLSRQGFTDGVFHCEGRVRDSSVSFQRSATTGYPALAPRGGAVESTASMYLIENNARAPAYMESVLVAVVYGVDLYAQQMLHALGPAERARYLALAEPFQHGPALHGLAQFIGAKESGHAVGCEDPARDVLLRVPSLAGLEHALVACSAKRKGDWVNGPETGVGGFLAWYAVVSATGLEDLLDIGAEIENGHAGVI